MGKNHVQTKQITSSKSSVIQAPVVSLLLRTISSPQLRPGGFDIETLCQYKRGWPTARCCAERHWSVAAVTFDARSLAIVLQCLTVAGEIILWR